MSLAETLQNRAARQRGEAAAEPASVPADPVYATPDAPPPKAAYRWSEYAEIGDSGELRRVVALPRRPPPAFAGPEVDRLVEELTARYRRPEGTMRLKAAQAVLLHEAERYGRVFGGIPVGGGKTLMTFLLARALGVKSAALLVPASLRNKIFEIEYPALQKHWYLPNLTDYDTYFPDVEEQLTVISYKILCHPNHGTILARVAPRLVIADEAHAVRDTSSAQGRRVRRYVRDSGALFVPVTGSPINRRISEAAGLLDMALGDGSPMPRPSTTEGFLTLQAWGDALDKPVGDRDPAPPGKLMDLAAPGEDVFAAFSRRLAETPGVILAPADDLPTSLNILARDVQIPTHVEKALNELRETWKTPDGYAFETALEFSRYARQLAAGLFYRTIWPRGEPLELRTRWLAARSEWFTRVRDFLSSPHAGPGMDSPELLYRAAAEGRWRVEEYAPWAAVREACEPDTEVVWVDEFLARDAVEWGNSRKRGGVIWFQHEPFGRRVAELGGFPFYNDSEEHGDALRAEKGDRVVVVSQNAFSEGNNLQAFSEALVTTASASGKKWEQGLGRFHRDGQQADSVDVDVYAHTPEIMAAVKSAIADARVAQRTTRATQKLLLATFGFDPAAPFPSPNSRKRK